MQFNSLVKVWNSEKGEEVKRWKFLLSSELKEWVFWPPVNYVISGKRSWRVKLVISSDDLEWLGGLEWAVSVIHSTEGRRPNQPFLAWDIGLLHMTFRSALEWWSLQDTVPVTCSSSMHHITEGECSSGIHSSRFSYWQFRHILPICWCT